MDRYTIATNHWLRSTVLVLLMLCAAQASAVTLIDDDRNVFIANDDGTTVLEPASPFAMWNISSHSSTVTPDRFFGVGSGNGDSDFFFSITESTFDITFSVAVNTLLDLGGALSGEDGTFGFGEATVRLFAGATTADSLVFSASGGSGNFVPFNFLDTLDPGMYRLILQTNITPGGFGTIAEWSFDANFTAMPVPLPAAGWLFGVAVLGLIRKKRRR